MCSDIKIHVGKLLEVVRDLLGNIETTEDKRGLKILLESKFNIRVHYEEHNNVHEEMEEGEIHVEEKLEPAESVKEENYDVEKVDDDTNDKDNSKNDCEPVTIGISKRVYELKDENIDEEDDYEVNSSTSKADFRKHLKTQKHLKSSDPKNKKHILNKSPPEKCPLCSELFTGVEGDDHIRSNHCEEGSYVCSYSEDWKCSFRTQDLVDFRKHLIVQHLFRPYYTCYLCPPDTDLFFTDITSVRRHMTSIHQQNKDDNSCPICEEKCAENTEKSRRQEKYDFALHLESHTSVQFSCQLCDFVRPSAGAMKAHYKFLHLKKNFKTCDICGKTDIYPHKFDYHMKSHSETHKESFPCEECGKGFPSKLHLCRHKSSVHIPAKFMCQICSKTFKIKGQLKRHSTFHSEERNFPCTECGMKFKSLNDTKGHMRQVHVEPSFKCNYCCHQSKTQTNLREHVRIHENNYGGHCKICNKNFIQKSNYKLHMKKSHPGIIP